MKNVKRLALCFAVIGLAYTANAQEPKKEKMAEKKHVCTQSCHDSGKHMYMHGETGHTCTDACKMPMTADKHTCTKACTADKHMYAHGEKGHACGDACKKH